MADFTDVRDQTDKALALLPDDRILWEKHLYDLSYHPDMDVADIFAQFVRWGDRFPAARPTSAAHDRTPGRRIRVGYVSPDFRRHTSRFYFCRCSPTTTTRWSNCTLIRTSNEDDDIRHARLLRPLARHPRPGDNEAAADPRRPESTFWWMAATTCATSAWACFALKPAPIQVTWLGAAWTTGLPAVDYVLFDRHIAPPPDIGAREDRQAAGLLRAVPVLG
ncbi:MAG: hypothetical protein H6930_13655 [Rhodoferax sp.]|nr:hypothetical protein [Rhodoferax sp.]